MEDKLKVFLATFDGVWHGGYAYVVAKDLTEAYKMIREEMNVCGLHNKTLNIDDVKEVDLSMPSVIDFDNGEQ